MHGLTVVLHLLVKSGVFVSGNHLTLLREIKLEVVDLLVSSGDAVFWFQRLVKNLNVSIHKLHTVSQSLLLWRRQSWGLLPEVAAVSDERRFEWSEHWLVCLVVEFFSALCENRAPLKTSQSTLTENRLISNIHVIVHTWEITRGEIAIRIASRGGRG